MQYSICLKILSMQFVEYSIWHDIMTIRSFYSILIPRFSPEDLRAVVFLPKLRMRIKFLSATFTAAIEGLETLHVSYRDRILISKQEIINQKKSRVLPDQLKGQMGVKITDEEGGTADLKNLLDDLIRHVVRADDKAWNSVIDTNNDILDKL